MNKPTTLPQWVDLINEVSFHVNESNRSKLIQSALEYLKANNLTQLGFWPISDGSPKYKAEDNKIFSDLLEHTQFPYINIHQSLDNKSIVLGVSINEDEEYEGEKLQVIWLSYLSDKMWDDPPYWVVSSAGIIYCYHETDVVWEILDAIVKSVELYKANNIPVEKWGIVHHPDVDPYTLKYIGPNPAERMAEKNLNLDDYKGNDLAFIDDIIERRRSVNKDSIEALTRVAEYLTEKGVSQLGLWSSFYLDKFDAPKYNEEDVELFEGISAPDNRVDFGGIPGENSDGFVYGVKVNNGKLVIVGSNNYTGIVGSDNYTREVNVYIPQDEILYNGWNVDNYDSLMRMISDTIKINVLNNIPTEKWGIAHYGKVDSYTWEPVDNQ